MCLTIRNSEFKTYLKKLTTPEEIDPVTLFARFRSPYLDRVLQRRIKTLLEWGADPRGLEDIVRAEVRSTRRCIEMCDLT